MGTGDNGSMGQQIEMGHMEFMYHGSVPMIGLSMYSEMSKQCAVRTEK